MRQHTIPRLSEGILTQLYYFTRLCRWGGMRKPEQT